MEYKPQGSYMALIGLVVVFLSNHGVIVNDDGIIQIIAAILSLIGIIVQFIAHRNLAKSAGAFK